MKAPNQPVLPDSPGMVLLRDYLLPGEITLETLSGDLNVPLPVLHRIIHDHGKITEEIGEKLDLYFNTPMGYWRKMWVDSIGSKPSLRKHPKPIRSKACVFGSTLKWIGLALAFSPCVLVLCEWLVIFTFGEPAIEFIVYLALGVLYACPVSLLLGIPIWGVGVALYPRHALKKVVEMLLVLALYGAAMVYCVPKGLIILGGFTG